MTNDLDDAIITLQALEALLAELDDSPTSITMKTLAARVMGALVRVQFAKADTVSTVPEEQRLADLEQDLRDMGPGYGPADHVKRHILNARDAIKRGDGYEYDREADLAEGTLNRPWGNA